MKAFIQTLIRPIWNGSTFFIFRTYSSNSSHPDPTKKKTKFKKRTIRHENYILNKELFGPLVMTEKERRKLIKSQAKQEQLVTGPIKNSCSSLPEKDDKNIMPKPISDEEIKIDNSEWENNVPSNLNITEILKFPLFNKLYKNSDVLGEVQSIGIFEGGYHKLPSVRKILDQTQTPERRAILEKWKKNMIKKLGNEKFEIYQENLLHRGTLLHGCLDLLLKQKIGPFPEQLVGIEELWMSVSNVIPKISDVRIVESRVIHPHLYYQGSIDCLATYKNKLVIIEFKTATKPKLTLQSTYDDPLQVAAYLGALQHDHNYSLPEIDGALLVVAYPFGLPAHAHMISREECEKYWSLWRQRVAKFWRMRALSPDDPSSN